jgi:hypothetical protein
MMRAGAMCYGQGLYRQRTTLTCVCVRESECVCEFEGHDGRPGQQEYMFPYDFGRTKTNFVMDKEAKHLAQHSKKLGSLEQYI